MRPIQPGLNVSHPAPRRGAAQDEVDGGEEEIRKKVSVFVSFFAHEKPIGLVRKASLPFFFLFSFHPLPAQQAEDADLDHSNGSAAPDEGSARRERK
jgi:hypothetical protein